MRSRCVGTGALALSLLACSGGGETKTAPSAPEAPAEQAPQLAAEDLAQALQAAADPDEACARAVVVAYKGAQFAAAEVTRDEAAAQARAEKLLGDLKAAPQRFDAVARAESDAPTSAARGGFAGTFTRADFPALHEALKTPLFTLQVHEFAAAPVQTPYGYVVLQRCPVEKAHGRHILIRYAGAKKAPEDVKRSKADALALAQKLRAELAGGADFAKLAEQHSEDGSSERGGDIGHLGRGLLAPAFEATLFSMKEGSLSEPVETDYGYHLIERLPPPSQP